MHARGPSFWLLVEAFAMWVAEKLPAQLRISLTT
jgi:hypothetical protein